MEAKDTVKKYQCSHEVIIDSKEWHFQYGYNLGAETQAEISFEAGYKQGTDDTLKSRIVATAASEPWGKKSGV